MKKVLTIIIGILLMFVPKVEACVIEYEEYKTFDIKQSYIVGDYVFVADNGYSPSLEDFAIAARTIPEDEEEYIYNVLITKIGTSEFFRFVEIFSNEDSRDESDFPYIDVTYEYRANIRGASEEDYDIYTCKVDTIKVNYTTLETEGELEYKTNATRTVNVSSSDGISGLKYCLTSGNECKPTTEIEVENGLAKIEYESMLGGQRVCVEAKDKNGNTSGVVCDETLVKVDKNSASVVATEELGTVVEKEPHTLEELFEINFSVSGGDVTYYYYVEENGIKTKYLLNNLADLPSGNIEVEAKVNGGNGLVTKKTRIIEVVKNKVTYDYMTNGGSSSSQETLEVVYKGKAKLNVTAEKAGYEFVGWNRNKDAHVGEENIEVTSDITLYAIFKKEIGANFNILSYDGSTPATSEYQAMKCEKYNNEEECEVIVPRISEKVGYEAFGWSKEEDKEEADYVGGETVKIKEETTMYSVTRGKIGKTATFVTYKDGTSTDEIRKCYVYNGHAGCEIELGEIESDDYEGRKLVGFTKDKNNVKKETTYETGTTYYAYYEDVYEVKYLSGVSKEEVEEAKVYYVITKTDVEEVVEEITLKEAEDIAGYNFIGYRTDDKAGSSEAMPGDKVNIEGDITYSAVYMSTFEISYKEEAEVVNTPGVVTGTKYYISRTREEIPYELVLNDASEIEKTGYVFVKWEIDGKQYDAGERVALTKETEVKAIWDINGCRIIFDYWTNGGINATKSSVTYINGSAAIDVSGVKASKTGWQFIGWTDKLGSSTNPLTTYKPTNTENDITLYAMFRKDITVNFRVQDTNAFSMSQGESRTLTLFNQETSKTTVLPGVQANKDGYEFIGWTTKENGKTKEYDAYGQVQVDKNTTFYTVTKEIQPVVVRYYYMEDESVKHKEVECTKYNREETCETEAPEEIKNSTYKGGVLSGFSTSAGSIEESEKQIVENDKVYYGIYDGILEIKYYSGILKANETVSTANVRYLVNPDIAGKVVPHNPTIVLETPDGIQGYTTLGWREDEEASAAEYEVGATKEISKSSEYYAVYERAITISYTSMGGDTTPRSETKTLIYNTVQDTDKVTSKFTLANEITRSGYEFAGWDKGNTGEVYEAGSEIELSGSTKMYAKWEAAKFNVTYDYGTNGGSSVSEASKKTVYGTQVDLGVTAEKTGYEFVGWSSEAGSSKVLEEMEMPAKDITLYAVYRTPLKAKWIITDENAATLEEAETVCYKYNNETSCKIETGAMTPKEGYTISGWTSIQGSIEVEAGNRAQTTIDKNMEYYSITRKTTAIVGTFYYGTESDGITETTSSCYLYNGASKCTIKEPLTPTTYKEAIFSSWSSEKDSESTATYEIGANEEYYSHYTKVVDVIYHDGSNDTLITDTDTVEYTLSDEGDAEVIPVFTIRTPTAISGYTTLGWREDAESHGEKTQASGEVKSLSTSYEYYGTYNRTIKLTYNANGGSSTPATQTDTQWYHSLLGATNHTFTLANGITRTGYTFNKWAAGSTSGAQTSAGGSVTIGADTTYYATWNANSYTVNFDGNGGTPSKASMSVTYDATYGTLATASRTGHTFAGWWTQASGGTQVTASTKVSITGTQTLYAHWTVNNYTLTVSSGGNGAVSTSSLSIPFGGSKTFTVTPNSGYYLSGVSCTSGYTASGFSTGMSYTAAQTVTVKNNSSAANGTCTATFLIVCPYSAGQTWEFNYTGNYQTFTIPCSGTYKLEAYGAQGGNGTGNSNAIGKGGYTVGTTSFNKSTNLYIYVGQQGYAYTSTGITSFNGGGAAGGGTTGHTGGGGGGATDFRLTAGTWNATDSLRSRILVAGGGGGAHSTCGGTNGNAGHGGGLTGVKTFNSGTQSYYGASASGGSQTAGGTAVGTYKGSGAASGGFGYGATAAPCGAGGGSGWFGGGSEYTANGGGGSSYVKGCSGCSTAYNSYQGSYTFSSTSLTQGNRSGHGYAKITLISITAN